ncbi:MAG: ABC transporter ATP-binding protein/permease [Actinobacteria bacterium]|nr:ABC transporter ATP-binding protein/permease [Actinomycetota bacterium]
MSTWRARGEPAQDDDARLSRDVAARVWTFARPHRRRFVGLFAVVAVSAVLGAIPPLLYRSIIDTAIADRRLGLLTVLSLGVIVVAVATAATGVVARWLSATLGEAVVYDLRVTLFEHIQRLPFAFFTRTQTGALTSRLTEDLQGGYRVFTETIASVASTILGVVVTLGAMFLLDWRLTLLSLSIAPLFIIVTRRMRGRLHRLITAVADANAAMSTQMTERFQVGGALLVKLLGRSDREREAFGARAGRVRELGVDTALTSRIFHVGFSLVATVGIGLVYWVGGRLVISETVTIGTLVAFAAYLTQLYAPLTMLANARVDLAKALVSFQRVFEVLDFQPAVAEPAAPVRLERPRGHVEFDRVWFRYPRAVDVTLPSLRGELPVEESDRESDWVLRDVSFTVDRGETVALVGPSGAGKTTVTMLVPRLYDVVEGAVRVDGHDVRELSLDDLGKAVGMVVQDTHLFHDTVRDNLLYANPDASERDLIEAAKAARIHDLIASLPDGYDTLVGERGYRFSGGEKQRLAIARLLLQDPAIAVLDEATAHLDSESERLIQQALGEALAGRSSIVIAHRLSTVVNADQLLVLDRGEVVERGTHGELIEAGGLYAELHRIQFSQPHLQVIEGDVETAADLAAGGQA